MEKSWLSLPEHILQTISKYLSLKTTINFFSCNKKWNQVEIFRDVIFSIHGDEITKSIVKSLDNILASKRISYDLIESSYSSLTNVRPLSFDIDSNINQTYSSWFTQFQPNYENNLRYLCYQIESNYILSSITFRLSEYNLDINDVFILVECKNNDDILANYSSEWIRLSYPYTIFKFPKPIISDKVVIYLKSNKYNNFISFESVSFLGIHQAQLDKFAEYKWIHLLQNIYSFNNIDDFKTYKSQTNPTSLQAKKMFESEFFLKMILMLNKGVMYIRHIESEWKNLWKRPIINDWRLIVVLLKELRKQLTENKEELKEIASCFVNIISHFITPNMSILNPKESKTYEINKENFYKNNGLQLILDVISCLNEEDYEYFTPLFVSDEDYKSIDIESNNLFSKMANSSNINVSTTYKSIKKYMKRLNHASNLRTFKNYDDFKLSLINTKSKKELLNVLYSFEKQNDISCIIYDIVDIQCLVIDQVYIKSRLKKLEDFGIGNGKDEKNNVLDILFNLFGFPDKQISTHAYNCFIKIWNHSGNRERQFMIAKIVSIPYLLPWKRALQLLWNCQESRCYTFQILFTFLMCTNMDSIKKNDAAKSFVFLTKSMNLNIIAKFISKCLIPNKKEEDNESVIVIKEDIDIENTNIYINYNNKEEIYSTMTGVLLLMKHYCKIEPLLRKIEELRIINTLIKVCIETMSWGVHELRLISEKIFQSLEKSGIRVSYHSQFFSIIGMKNARQSIQLNEHDERISKLEHMIESLTKEISQLKKQSSKKKIKEDGVGTEISSEKLYRHKSSKSEGSSSPKIKRKTISNKYHSDSSITKDILIESNDLNIEKKPDFSQETKHSSTNGTEKKSKKSRGSFLKVIRKLKGSVSDESIRTSKT